MYNITKQWFGIKSADISNDLFPSERPLILDGAVYSNQSISVKLL